MRATDLSPEIWNAIADLVAKSGTPREHFFVKITRVDKIKKLIWVREFGDLAIPLVSHAFSFSYFDTVPVGNAVSGSPIGTQAQKREDKTQDNPAMRVEIVTPKVGQVAIVIDPSGAKNSPYCVGVVQSKTGYWEGG